MKVDKPKFNNVLAFLLLLAIFTAGFTVFCQMPGNNHSYSLLLGKDNCPENQPPQGCGSVQSSQDVLGFNLLSDSLVPGMFLALSIIVLLGLVYVFTGIVPLFQAGVRCRFRLQFLARLYNYLIQAFSQGILNPRLFA